MEYRWFNGLQNKIENLQMETGAEGEDDEDTIIDVCFDQSDSFLCTFWQLIQRKLQVDDGFLEVYLLRRIRFSIADQRTDILQTLLLKPSLMKNLQGVNKISHQ